MRWATLAVAIGVSGCASSGTKVTAADMASFTPGRSTETDVIGRLGDPNSSSTAPDGTKTDIYIYAHASANAANFIPVVGLLAGGATSQTTTATFVFDNAGVLRSTSSGRGHSNVNTGLLNQ
jgi:hypothetical protein